MRKIWSIALKDTMIRFRDRNGILLMLVAPLVLALIIGAAFGGFGGGNGAPINDIPIVVVNADEGAFGQNVVEILTSVELADLLRPSEMADLEAAIALVERGEVRAVVYVPADFSAIVESQDNVSTSIFLYTDPTATFSPLVLKAILSEIANTFNSKILAGRVSVEQLLATGNAIPDVAELSATIAGTLERAAAEPAQTIMVNRIGMAENANDAGALAYFAPSMAILFLMFTIFDASRSILSEERDGTLQRMMASPTSFVAILAGKHAGVFLTGFLQLSILFGVSALFFGLSWGSSPLGVIAMTIAVVAAASSLGVLIVALARDATQAAVIGSALALIFAILGGNFVVAAAYPPWLQPLSKLTINRWAIDGLTELSLRNGGLQDVLTEVLILLTMSVVLFAIAAWRLPRRFVR